MSVEPVAVDRGQPCSAAAGSLISSALNYAAAGMSVFPLAPCGKTPLTPNGFKDASVEPEQVRTWWTRWPDANIGVATGRRSDLAVLDIDGETGERSLRDLPEPLPATWCVLTGRGAHLWFRFPDRELRNSAGKVGDGLDVRAEGGYVIAPPSVHPNSAVYQWIGARRERAAWPAWLQPPQNEPMGVTQSLRTYRPGVTGQGDRYARAALTREADAVRSAAVGSRNDRLNRAAFNLARFVPHDLRAAEVANVLLAAAAAAGLPEREARRTVASGLQRSA